MTIELKKRILRFRFSFVCLQMIDRKRFIKVYAKAGMGQIWPIPTVQRGLRFPQSVSLDIKIENSNYSPRA